MEENKIELKTISDLLGMNFLIPSYQRGYRWEKQQVLDLLNDIWDFIESDPKKEDWYCLQPVVVKKYNDVEWEVIDGQQRLTTIFLILKHLERFIESEKKTFSVKYETRPKSQEFLEDIISKVKTDADENIDFYHIFFAFNTISEWFKNKSEKYNSVSSKFITPFLDKTKVIWYETAPQQDAVDIFTRINMGKIPLTNAELIKALFLNSSNFKDKDEEKIRLKQLEIATEWDFIEYSLHNDEFWLFINQNENNTEPRIEFIFELVVGGVSKDDTDYVFREYYKKFENKNEQTISNNWKEIKRYFQTMQDWFENRELYHKIGYLITSGSDIKIIISASFDKDKEKFVQDIDDVIKAGISRIRLEDLEYKDRMKVKEILLLHNIQTMLNNEKENSRFPFNRYKTEKWNIEHIHAIATKKPDKLEHKEDWINYAKEMLEKIKITDKQQDNEKLITEKTNLISSCSNFTENMFDEIYENINNYVEKIGLGDINDLENLVLLDSKTNREYRNEFFSYKRKTIIKKEKEGTFVPLCTKNVFMKYYTPKVEQMTFWGQPDREEYFKDIKTVLKQYLSNQ